MLLVPKTRFERLLYLGTEHPLYWRHQHADPYRLKWIQPDAFLGTIHCVANDPAWSLSRIIEVNREATIRSGLLLGLAFVIKKGEETKQEALETISELCTEDTDILWLASNLMPNELFSDGLQKDELKALRGWYERFSIRDLARKIIQTGEQGTRSHRGLARTLNLESENPVRNNLYRWLKKGFSGLSSVNDSGDLELVYAYEAVHVFQNPADVAKVISRYNLPSIVVPERMQQEEVVQEALDNLSIKPSTRPSYRASGKKIAVAIEIPDPYRADEYYVRLHQIHLSEPGARFFYQGHQGRMAIPSEDLASFRNTLLEAPRIPINPDDLLSVEDFDAHVLISDRVPEKTIDSIRKRLRILRAESPVKFITILAQGVPQSPIADLYDPLSLDVLGLESDALQTSFDFVRHGFSG